ncbi:hypothetical protein TUBRATIS_14440 [Tubulinosema ratisbonensis]|uniref:Uncharacterized protein n=1 Tax=Tubulinosema ratisbonensis TaxID=291195 RepID=A0A437ALS0_9MICR|nr:hypothetical protein TUBRATIS_14440 [Tubulinosema ratisbonensis]
MILLFLISSVHNSSSDLIPKGNFNLAKHNFGYKLFATLNAAQTGFKESFIAAQMLSFSCRFFHDATSSLYEAHKNSPEFSDLMHLKASLESLRLHFHELLRNPHRLSVSIDILKNQLLLIQIKIVENSFLKEVTIIFFFYDSLLYNFMDYLQVTESAAKLEVKYAACVQCLNFSLYKINMAELIDFSLYGKALLKELQKEKEVYFCINRYVSSLSDLFFFANQPEDQNVLAFFKLLIGHSLKKIHEEESEMMPQQPTYGKRILLGRSSLFLNRNRKAFLKKQQAGYLNYKKRLLTSILVRL